MDWRWGTFLLAIAVAGVGTSLSEPASDPVSQLREASRDPDLAPIRDAVTQVLQDAVEGNTKHPAKAPSGMSSRSFHQNWTEALVSSCMSD